MSNIWQARNLFDLSAHDLGRPFQDLEVSYRPVELRSSIDKAIQEKKPMVIRNIEWTIEPEDKHFFEIRIQPLLINNNSYLGTLIAFTVNTQHKQVENKLEKANHELESAYEELQSTNEELHAMNDEFRIQTDELNRVNNFLEAVMTSVKMGVVILDRDLRVKAWNQKAADLWGLREEVRDHYFLKLDIGLPVEQLLKPINHILNDETDQQGLTLMARNRRGREVEIKVTSAPFIGQQGQVQGAILMMETK